MWLNSVTLTGLLPRRRAFDKVGIEREPAEGD